VNTTWTCEYCRRGGHDRCVSRILCGCVHEVEIWLSPDRRAALRAGARPVDSTEDEYQRAYRAHQHDRRTADEQRR
jgi:hypothetical protein